MHMLSLFLRMFFLSLDQKFFFHLELLRPLVSVNNDFLKLFIFEVPKKLLKRKREGGSEPAPKRPRVEAARPRWVEDTMPSATMQMGPPGGRGGGQGRGRRPWG
jgi:hypothetical protein